MNAQHISHSLHQAHTATHGLKHATEHDGLQGALGGAVGIAGGVAVTLGLFGLALTPLGWAVMAAAGATAGGSGAIKALKHKLS